jgi:hypothetical protein
LSLPAKERVHTRVGGTNRKCLYYSRTMSKLLVTQFERFAECCLELARSAETPARRARLVKMAHEYRQATEMVAPRMESRSVGMLAHEPESPSSGPNQMTVLTMRSRRSHFIVTGPNIELVKFKTRQQARNWCAANHPGLLIHESGADTVRRAPRAKIRMQRKVGWWHGRN